MITTVRGPMPADDLGFCLPHEHVLIDLWRNSVNRWDTDGVLNDKHRQTEELRYYLEAGGRSIVDLSLPAIGQDPAGLAWIAATLDTPIIMGCGWYRQPYYGPEIDTTPTDTLAGQLIDVIVRGVGEPGIRPGIIGEIGSHKHYVTAQEERVFRAAGLAGAETGLAVTTHSVASDVGLHHLKLLMDSGMAPERIIIGHADSYLSLPYLLAVLDSGAYLQFDNIGYPLPRVAALEEDLVAMILELLGRGWAERILLSQDVCWKGHLRAYGGAGYAYLPRTFAGVLAAAGVSDEDWRTMTEANPRRVLDVP
jgi:predicted metal-dependent phosphotriesterase family hydrolase